MQSSDELCLEARSIEIYVSANPVVRCRSVSLAGCVFGEKDIAGMKTHARAIAETDIYATGKRNDPAPSWGTMKIDDVRCESGSNQ